MNNTPRTDAAVWGETDVVEASFARQLETELAAVTKERDEARDTIAMLTNTLRNNNDAARAGYEELKAELAAVEGGSDE